MTLFASLLAAYRASPEGNADLLGVVCEEKDLQAPWLRLLDEIENRSVDLGFVLEEFVSKGRFKSSQNPTQNDENGSRDGNTVRDSTARLDWFELCFHAAYQLKNYSEEAEARSFPIEMPRKQRELWQRKKIKLIADVFDVYEAVSAYEGLCELNKTVVKWCFLLDVFLAELQERQLRQWKRVRQTMKSPPVASCSQLTRQEVVEQMQQLHPAISAIMSDDEVLQCIRDFTTKAKEQHHCLPVKAADAPTQLNGLERSELLSINKSFRRDYTLRRALMLERCDVTLESFTWSKAGKEHQMTMERELQALRSTLLIKPRVIDVDDIFQEKQDVREVIKDPVSSIRTIVIGPVPDRGGRTSELDDKTMNQAAKGNWGSQIKRESKESGKQRKSKTARQSKNS